jgi:rubrerythrin
MNLWMHTLHLLGSGATAYILSRNLCDRQSRPNLLAGFQLAEAGSVPFLEKLSQRASQEGDDWLADRLQRHASDERRHAQIFSQALKRLNKHAITPSDRASSNSNASEQSATEQPRRRTFFSVYYDGYSKDDLAADAIDWTVFLASTHILEHDACRDFMGMARSLSGTPADQPLRDGLLSIAKDEERHAAYLYEALERRMPASDVTTVVEQWRSRKVEAMFAMVQNFMQQQGKMHELAQDGAPVEEPEAAIA